MTTPAAVQLSEAGQLLARVEALVRLVADDLGPPCDDALRRLADDAVRLRRRLRNATTTATAGGDRA